MRTGLGAQSASSSPVLLVSDDDPWVQAVAVALLREHGFNVHVVSASSEASPDLPVALSLVEIGRRNDSGEFPFEAIAARTSSRVIVLGRAITCEERIAALESGADDVIVVPCNPRELLARARAVLRRRLGAGPQPLA